MIDEKGRIWLMEINANPSLVITDSETDEINEFDKHIKVKLIADVVEILKEGAASRDNQFIKIIPEEVEEGMDLDY